MIPMTTNNSTNVNALRRKCRISVSDRTRTVQEVKRPRKQT
jgi:hypothetical protein